MADDDKTAEQKAAETQSSEGSRAQREATEQEDAELEKDDFSFRPEGRKTEDEPFDKDRAMTTIRALRAEVREAKAQGKRADELERRLKDIEDAGKSDLERAQAKVAEYEAKERAWAEEKRETALKLAVHEKAGTLGIASPTLALAALDRSRIEWGDDGAPSNLDDQLTLLLEREPILKGETKISPTRLDGGGGGGGDKPVQLTAEESAMAAKLGMTPERYAAMRGVSTPEQYEALREREKQAAAAQK